MTDKQLTVEDIISKLQKVKNKKTPVYIGNYALTMPIISITEEDRKVLLNVDTLWSE